MVTILPTEDLLNVACVLCTVFDAPVNNATHQHSGFRANLPEHCHAADRPITALLTDLKG